MEELIQQLQTKYGLSAEHSQGIINTILSYIGEKFPMASGIIDKFTGAQNTQTISPAITPTEEGGGLLEKIEDFAKNELKEILPGN